MVFVILSLLFFGIALIYLETLLPGGIVGAMGFVCIIASIWLGFRHYGFTEGIVLLLTSLLIVSFLVIFLWSRFPKSRIGQKIILSDEMESRSGYHADSFTARISVGLEGIAESELRPAGIALINGERCDVVSDGGFIEARARIRVIRVDGNRVVVERAHTASTPVKQASSMV